MSPLDASLSRGCALLSASNSECDVALILLPYEWYRLKTVDFHPTLRRCSDYDALATPINTNCAISATGMFLFAAQTIVYVLVLLLNFVLVICGFRRNMAIYVSQLKQTEIVIADFRCDDARDTPAADLDVTSSLSLEI